MIMEPNSIMEGYDIVRFVERGSIAMSRHPMGKGKMKVLSIDGAIINKIFPSGIIIPSKMNAGDGGKNREEMNIIGLAGLRSVLTAMGVDVEGLNVEGRVPIASLGMRRCKSQLTSAEEVARKYGVILIFTPKSPPRFSLCEPFFRWQKFRLQKHFNVPKIIERIIETDRSFLISQISDDNKTHLDKWIKRSLKYAEYFAKGGKENIRENEMERVDLARVGGPLPHLLIIRDQNDLANVIHDSNWILIRGKYSPETPKSRSAREDWVDRLGQGS